MYDTRRVGCVGRSAFIATAIAEHGRYEQLAVLLSEMAAQAGPPTEEDRRWARETLGLT